MHRGHAQRAPAATYIIDFYANPMTDASAASAAGTDLPRHDDRHHGTRGDATFGFALVRQTPRRALHDGDRDRRLGDDVGVLGRR